MVFYFYFEYCFFFNSKNTDNYWLYKNLKPQTPAHNDLSTLHTDPLPSEMLGKVEQVVGNEQAVRLHVRHPRSHVVARQYVLEPVNFAVKTDNLRHPVRLALNTGVNANVASQLGSSSLAHAQLLPKDFVRHEMVQEGLKKSCSRLDFVSNRK